MSKLTVDGVALTVYASCLSYWAGCRCRAGCWSSKARRLLRRRLLSHDLMSRCRPWTESKYRYTAELKSVWGARNSLRALPEGSWLSLTRVLHVRNNGATRNSPPHSPHFLDGAKSSNRRRRCSGKRYAARQGRSRCLKNGMRGYAPGGQKRPLHRFGIGAPSFPRLELDPWILLSNVQKRKKRERTKEC